MSRFESLRRLVALVRKEARQMRRDPSVIVVSFFLPLVLLLLFGYGLSMDLKDVPVAVVLGESSPQAQNVAERIDASPYFRSIPTASREAAERLLAARRIEAIVDIPPGFERDAAQGKGEIGLVVHGVDANSATIIRTYVAATLQIAAAKNAERGATVATVAATSGNDAPSAVRLLSRAWFNEANTSTWYLVPGLTIVLMTLVSSFLGSVVIAREWERGTMEALALTPASPFEILASKFLAYFALATAGEGTAILTSIALFDVPVRGSGWVLAGVFLLYNVWALAFGLFLSAALKRQFVAMQMAVIGSYLPALILSGFIFDLRSVPDWISAVGHLMPPTYAMETVKILFLSGGANDVVLENVLILALWTTGFMLAALAVLRKRMD